MTDLVPLSISTYLYSGISNGIQRLIKLSDTLSPEYIRKECDDLTEVLEWYKEHCAVSYNILKRILIS